MIKQAILFFVLSLFVASCYYNNFDELHPAVKLNTTCDTLSVMSYTNNIKPVLDNYCVSCHNSSTRSGNIVLDTYSGAYSTAKSGKLLGSSAHKNGYVPMPPNSKIDACSIRQIELWVNKGANNN